MKTFKYVASKAALILGLSGGLVSVSNAALFDRGNGLIYDSAQNITWLKDANYAATQFTATGGAQGDADGLMNWNTAVAWADQLSYGGYDDWRLPRITDTGTPGCNHGFSGTDCGYNVDTSTSELAYMYDYLDNTPYFNSSGHYTGVDGLQSSSADGITFTNLQSYVYWSGTEFAPDTTEAWYFSTHFGRQGSGYKGFGVYAWAVRSGDVAAVAPVPLPGAAWLFGAGLVGLIGLKRRSA